MVSFRREISSLKESEREKEFLRNRLCMRKNFLMTRPYRRHQPSSHHPSGKKTLLLLRRWCPPRRTDLRRPPTHLTPGVILCVLEVCLPCCTYLPPRRRKKRKGAFLESSPSSSVGCARALLSLFLAATAAACSSAR